MAYLIVMLAAVTTGVDVEVSMSDGTVTAGSLDSLSTEAITVTREGEIREVEASKLRRIIFPASTRAAEPPLAATLSDGSILRIDGFQATNGVATLKTRSMSAPLSVPSRSLSAVRLLPLNGEVQTSWSELLGQPTAADVVIVLRKDNRLQPIEGVLGDIDDAVVDFQFDGEWIDVRRDKVAGIRFANATSENQPLPRGQLTMADGSRLELQGLRPDENDLNLVTPNGTELRLTFDQVLYVDFAALSTVYLSDMQPESMTTRPYVHVAAMDEAEQMWFRPQNDRSLSRNTLSGRIDGAGREFSRGLGFHSRTDVTYRLVGQYRRLLAWAALEDVGANGRVMLIISTDNRECYREEIIVGEDAKKVDIDLKGANRLRIEVDYGDPSDQGDHLNLCDARLIK